MKEMLGTSAETEKSESCSEQEWIERIKLKVQELLEQTENDLKVQLIYVYI